ncbi:hypothetical protein ACFYYP_26360 [Microbispora rosea]|uniref:hypothetical protein n=1 Tax=Microbispora rosea TaxID=58117 RepID=UPI003677049D
MRPEISAIGRLAVIGALGAAAIGCSGGGVDARDSPASTAGTPAAVTRPEVVPSLSGGTWTETRTAGAGAVMESVAATGHDEAWAVSSPGENRRSGPILRWDGRAWQSVALPPGLRHPRVASGTSGVSGGLWALTGDRGSGPTVERWDGRRWTYEKTPRVHNDPEVFDLATIPGENRVFAVGGNPSYDEDSQAWIWTRS